MSYLVALAHIKCLQILCRFVTCAHLRVCVGVCVCQKQLNDVYNMYRYVEHLSACRSRPYQGPADPT